MVKSVGISIECNPVDLNFPLMKLQDVMDFWPVWNQHLFNTSSTVLHVCPNRLLITSPLIPSVAQNISLPYSPVVYVPITLPGQPTVTLPGQQTPSYIYDTHCSLSFHIIFVKEIFQGAQDAEFVIYVLKMESHIPLLTIYACSIKSMLYSQILVLVVTKCHQT